MMVLQNLISCAAALVLKLIRSQGSWRLDCCQAPLQLLQERLQSSRKKLFSSPLSPGPILDLKTETERFVENENASFVCHYNGTQKGVTLSMFLRGELSLDS